MLTIVKKNDSYDAITYQLENEDNSTVDLTGASVNFVMGKKNKLITNAKATVTSATSGIVSYQLTPSDTLVSGTFLAEFVVTFANGTTKTYPSNGYITVDVEQNLDTSQNNVVLDMIATKQGDFEAKLDSILKQGTGTQVSAMNEYTWTATSGQTIFVFPTNAKYDPSAKWFQVSVGNVPIANELINRASSSQFSLVVDPSLIVAGMTVHAMWVEPIVPITGGHHSTHEINGQDEINIANLRNYQELVATPLADITSQVSDIATDIERFPRLVGETDDTGRITRAISSLTNGGEILFPAKTYTINSSFQLNGVSNIKLRGLKGCVLLVDSTITFLSLINATNCSIEGFTIKEKTYATNQWFNEITLNPATILTANTNANITVTINNNQFTIAKNGITPQGTEQTYTVSIVIPDTTKEYSLQTYDGLVSGENMGSRIKMVQHLSGGNKNYNLDDQVNDSGSVGNWIWHTNYIPVGCTQIDIQFPYDYMYNSDNNSVTYDLSKIKLFQAVKTLPTYTNNMNINIQNCSKIDITNNQFIGMLAKVIDMTGSSNTDITYEGNQFYNCVIGHMGFGYINRCDIKKNRMIIQLVSDTGQEVAFTKASTRGIACGGSATGKGVRIKDNYGYGLTFGAEIWSTTGLLIDNFVMDKCKWALSLANGTRGRVVNSTFNLLDNWWMGIEIVSGTKVDVDNVTFTGRSYRGYAFSATQNTGGDITISNVTADSCFIFLQFTDNGINLKNIEVREIIGVGVLGLSGGNFSNSYVLLDTVKMTNSTSLKTTSTGYRNSFININHASNYLSKLTMRNSQFIGKPNSVSMQIKVNELVCDNVKTDSSTYWAAQITLNNVSNVMNFINNCQLYNWSFVSYPTAANSSLVVTNNKTYNTTIPTGATIVTSNNIAAVAN
jgi:hypothetical protein